jgi:hypothetical protein
MVDFEYFAGEPGTGPTFLMMSGSYVSSEWRFSSATDAKLGGGGTDAPSSYERPPVAAAVEGRR